MRKTKYENANHFRNIFHLYLFCIICLWYKVSLFYKLNGLS